MSHKAPTLPYARSLGPRRAEPGTGRRRTPPGGLTEWVPEQPAGPAHRGTDHTVALSAEVWDIPAPGIPGTRAVPSPPRNAGIGFGRTGRTAPFPLCSEQTSSQNPEAVPKTPTRQKRPSVGLRQSSDLQCRRRDDGTRTTLGSATPLHPFNLQTPDLSPPNPQPPAPRPLTLYHQSPLRHPTASTLYPWPPSPHPSDL